MGYYTAYKVEASPEAIEWLEENTPYEFIHEEDNVYQTDEVKWYSCRDDLTQLSKELTCKVVVHGVGSDRDDYWWATYINGKEEYYKGVVSVKYYLVETDN